MDTVQLIRNIDDELNKFGKIDQNGNKLKPNDQLIKDLGTKLINYLTKDGLDEVPVLKDQLDALAKKMAGINPRLANKIGSIISPHLFPAKGSSDTPLKSTHPLITRDILANIASYATHKEQKKIVETIHAGKAAVVEAMIQRLNSNESVDSLGITDTEIEEFLIDHGRRVTSLNLRDFDGDNPIRLITHCPNLKHLCLPEDASEEKLKMLEEIDLPNLITLDFASVDIEIDGANAIAAAIEKLAEQLERKQPPEIPNLTDLNFECMGMKADIAAVLFPAFAKCKMITKINLGYNDLGNDKGMEVLAQFLSNFKYLTALDLTCNKIGKEGIKTLAAAVSNFSKLRKLVLNNNSIEDCRAIAEMIQNLNSLEIIAFEKNNIGDTGAGILAEAIMQNKKSKLTELFLAENKIGDKGATALGEALKEYPEMELSLRYNPDIGVEVTDALKLLGKKVYI